MTDKKCIHIGEARSILVDAGVNEDSLDMAVGIWGETIGTYEKILFYYFGYTDFSQVTDDEEGDGQ